MIFHLLCPGSGSCWKPGLRFCAHTDGVRGQEDCGGSGIVVLDRGPGDRDSGDRDSVVLGIVQCSCSWISSAPMAYLPIVL